MSDSNKEADESFIKDIIDDFLSKVKAIPDSLERDVTDDAIEAVVKLIDDRDEWKQQHENLLSVRQSDLKVIEQLQSQLAAALAKNKELKKDYAIWKEYTGKVNDKNIELERRIKESQEQEPVADITDAQLAAFKVISGSEACPLCGDAFIHTHSPKEIVIYRNGVKYGRKLYAAPVINQQPASEPDTSESREAEIDKERHHGY